MEITKELVERLSDDNITKKEYNSIVAAINNKVDEIWRYICKVSERELSWWAFSNDVSYGRGNGSSGGEFDPKNDATSITINGECEECNIAIYEYNYDFPTSFLWEDYKTIVNEHWKKCQESIKEEKEKKEKKKQKFRETIASIKSKLTQEELKTLQGMMKDSYRQQF